MRCVRTTLPWMSITVTATGTLCFDDSASTRSAMFFAMVSKSMVVCSCQKERWAVRTSAFSSELSHMESESIFRVSGLLEPLLQEDFDAFLRGGSLDGGHAGVPVRSDFDVGWQAGFVHEVLGVADRPLVERSDPGCECVDETVQLGIR